MTLPEGQQEIWDDFVAKEFPEDKDTDLCLRVLIPDEIEPHDESIALSDVILWVNAVTPEWPETIIADEVVQTLSSYEDTSALIRSLPRQYDEETNQWFLVVRVPEVGADGQA